MRRALQVIPLDCGGCGLCCKTQCYPPFFDYERPFVPAELLAEIDAALEADDGTAPGCDAKPCLWFDEVTGQCKHYEDRPDVCQDFVVGSDDCLEWRDELIESSGKPSVVER
jgi:Fe-S-cluster containining protein